MTSLKENKTNENTNLKNKQDGHSEFNNRDNNYSCERPETQYQFHVLDEFIDDKSSVSDDEYPCSSSEFDISDEETDAMLGEGLPDELKNSKIEVEKDDNLQNREKYDKTVLMEKESNHSDVLPEGWVQVTHDSGMPIYFNKTLKVCAMSKPYFLGPDSVRAHQVPVSAIPCLSYRQALEAEKRAENSNCTEDVLVNDVNLSSTRIETEQENRKSGSLTPEALREYCENLFKFKTIRLLRFRKWSERRKYYKRCKREKKLQCLISPAGTKLIAFPIQSAENKTGSNNSSQRQFILNPIGKNYINILQEYVQHTQEILPTYKYGTVGDGTRHKATVFIDGHQYGVGCGTRKKEAKSKAAKITLDMLNPEIGAKISATKADEAGGPTTSTFQDQGHLAFDEMAIIDPRVAELTIETGELLPNEFLLMYVCRQPILYDIKQYHQTNLKNGTRYCTITLGEHTATVVSDHKYDGVQIASQAILQKLHPNITSWGSLLSLYRNCSSPEIQEKNEMSPQQSNRTSPDYEMLNKLKVEMLKFRQKRMTAQPTGAQGVAIPGLSCSNLNYLNL